MAMNMDMVMNVVMDKVLKHDAAGKRTDGPDRCHAKTTTVTTKVPFGCALTITLHDRLQFVSASAN